MTSRYERLPRDRRIVGPDYAVDVQTGEVLHVGPDDLGVARLKQSSRELGQALGLVAWWCLSRVRRSGRT